MRKEPISIDLLGTTLRVNTDEDPGYLSQLIEYLQQKTIDVKNNSRLDDPLKISILTSLFLIDELFKERISPESRDNAEDLEVIATSMLRKLESTLEK